MFQNLQKTDLYRKHQMSKDFDGGCFTVDISDVVLENQQDIYRLLDTVCALDKLHPIGAGWRALNYADGKATLEWSFQNDLAYSTTRLGKNKTQKYCKLVLAGIDPENCQCFTNWRDNPWDEKHVRSWHGISHGTFEIAIVFLDTQKLVLTYLTSED